MRFRRTSPSKPPAGAEVSRRHPGRPRPRTVVVAAGAAVAVAGTVAGVAALGLAGPTASSATGGSTTGRGTTGPDATDPGATGHNATGGSTAGRSATGHGATGHSATGHDAARTAAQAARAVHPAARGGGSGSPAQPTAVPAQRRSPRTSCRSVAHIGDSTSVDLISSAFLPSKGQQLAARYAGVGVRHLKIDASGGRSIVEELPGQVNGYNVASAWRSQGYQGCWVFALGTNDTANVAAGSSVGMMARISEMMSVAHGQPVMWVNTRTELSAGDWSGANERLWDATLVRAMARYPNMRIFDWSAVARPSWFLPDGIHYNTLGCAMRARAIAGALARAFPLNGASKGQIVR